MISSTSLDACQLACIVLMLYGPDHAEHKEIPMASVRRLAQGGDSVRVSDTELSLLRACVDQHDQGDRANFIAAMEGLDDDQRRLMTEALGIRDDALTRLSKSLADTNGHEDDDED
jgi:hypothetical protein